MANSDFQIRRPSPHEARSLVVPSAMTRWTAVQIDTTTPANAAAANGSFVGFCTYEVTTDGPAVTDFMWPPGQLEPEVKAGATLTIIDADEVECEGTDHILLSGTGALSASTAEGTLLSFSNGKFYETQSGDTSYYELVAVSTDVVNSANSFRITAVRI